MTIEVHIARSVFGTVVGRAIQQQLRATCFPALGPFRVDHVNAVPDAVVAFAPDNGGVDVRVPVDVFVVADEAVRAAPNAVPTMTTVSGTLVLRMAAQGATALVQVVDVDVPGVPLPVGVDQLKSAVIAASSRPLQLDLTRTLDVLGMPASARSTVELTDETVAIRFDPTTPVRSRLHPGQEWGAFLDEQAVLAFARERVPNLPEVEPRITSFEPVEHWRPEGGRPRIDVEFRGKAAVPDPLSGDFDGAFRLRLGVAPTVQPQLRVDVEWELHANLGALVPGFVDNLVEIFATAMIDPTKFGAVRTGIRSFQRDIPLPTIEFGPQVAGIATRFEWKSVVAVADGITLGGPVRPLSDPGVVTVETAVTAFGRPRGTVYASQHGCVFGWQSEIPTDLMAIANVGLAGCGSVCGNEVLEPHSGLEQYVQIDVTSTEAQTLRMRLPLAVAKDVTSPVRVIVYTSRGVRLIDFGAPLADEEAEIAYIDDCLYADAYLTSMMAYDEWWSLWGDFPEVWQLVGGPPPLPTRPNPLDDPDPGADLDGLYVKVITVDDWEAGELVQVRTGTCTIDVTTDQLGRATIPVILAGADRAQPISLTRVNRGDVGSARAQTAIFVRHAALPGGTSGNTLTVDETGKGLVSVDFEEGSDVFELVRDASPRQVGGRSTKVRAPARQAPSVELELPGLTEIVDVPGFSDAGVAIAVMDDGAQLVLNRSADGSTRVAGAFNGRLPRLDVAGEWAVAPSRERLTVFRRTRA
jgi:hypothetical protein